MTTSPQPRAYTAVIFDFGGVITTSPFARFTGLEAARGVPEGTIRAINTRNPHDNAWARFERAEIDGAAFDALFLQESGGLIRGADVIACIHGKLRPRMVAALDQLQAAGYRLGCITNNVPNDPMTGGSHSEVQIVMSRFEHVIESSKAGVRKPDPRIYQMMCDHLRVSPDQCVYLDDLGINCKPAAALGMAAIKVVSEAQALDDLARLLEIEWEE